MIKFLIKRLLQGLPVLFIVVTVTFFMMKLAPGGPFSTEKAIPKEILAKLNEQYHLNDPMLKQYIRYVGDVATANFGPSFKYPGRTVNELISTGFPITFELGFYALIVAVILGTISGIFAAIRPNTWQDYIPMSFSMAGICLPTMLMGPLLALIFGIWFEWLPVSGWDGPEYKILPAITLGTVYAAYIARLSRGGMLEILSQDFIRTARAKGVKEKMVIIKHALKGGLLPVVSFLGPAAAGLLSGSFVVETVFQIPGLGRYFVQASFNRDYTMIMGTTVFYALLIVLFNILSDTMQIVMNPKLNFENAKGGK